MLRCCPPHVRPNCFIIHTFYIGLTYSTKTNLDIATNWSLVGKSADGSHTLTKEMAANSYPLTNERGSRRNIVGMYKIDISNMLEAKLKNVLEIVLAK